MGLPSREDWRNAVMKHREIQGETRATLLYLASRMGVDRKFSVPQGELARSFDVSTRTIRDRIEQAHEAGLLVTVLPGKPGRTAVYEGTFPDPACAGRTAQETTKHVWEGAHKQTPEYVRHVVPPNSKRSAPETHGLNEPRGDVKQAQQGTSEMTSNPVGPLTSSVAPERSDAPPEAQDNPHPQASTSFPHRASAPSGDDVKQGRSSAARETPKGIPDSTRKTILTEIMTCAAADGYANETLLALLEDLDPDGGLSDFTCDYWSFPKAAATDRYVAGQQLNKLINTWKAQAA